MNGTKIWIGGTLAMALVACGSSSSSDAGPAVTDSGPTVTDAGPTDAGTDGGATSTTGVTISGVATSFPLNAAVLAADGTLADGGMVDAGTLSFTDLTIAIVNPLAALSGDGGTLAQEALNTSASNCTNGDCAFSFTNVAISAAVEGLVAEVIDDRTSGQLWEPTATGIANGTTVLSTPVGGSITGVEAFGVTVQTEAFLAGFVSTTNGAAGPTFAAGELVKAGFMIGEALDPSNNPVTGATVTSTNSNVKVYYPNATFSANGTSTAASGLFLIVPSSSTAVSAPASQLGTISLTGAGHTWAGGLVGSNPGSVFVILEVASS